MHINFYIYIYFHFRYAIFPHNNTIIWNEEKKEQYAKIFGWIEFKKIRATFFHEHVYGFSSCGS